MSRRKQSLLLIASLGIGVAGFIVVGYPGTPDPAVTLENFDRLHGGMSLAQVEAILGPPDEADALQHSYGWNTADVQIHIAFSPEQEAMAGVAIAGQVTAFLRPPPSLLDSIKALLHL